jgi:aarF domain-containing kinase
VQRVGDMSEEFKKMRAQMEEDEQLASLMRGLRGQNLSDSLFAADDVQLRLVEVRHANLIFTRMHLNV